jgi:hypothetical protein
MLAGESPTCPPRRRGLTLRVWGDRLVGHHHLTSAVREMRWTGACHAGLCDKSHGESTAALRVKKRRRRRFDRPSREPAAYSAAVSWLRWTCRLSQPRHSAGATGPFASSRDRIQSWPASSRRGTDDLKGACPRRELHPLGCSYPSVSGYEQHEVGTSVDASTQSERARSATTRPNSPRSVLDLQTSDPGPSRWRRSPSGRESFRNIASWTHPRHVPERDATLSNKRPRDALSRRAGLR